MAVARENPAKRLSIVRITGKMVQDDPELSDDMICDVEVWGDQMPAHVRLFDCRQCPGGGTRQNMRAGQMLDHLLVFHKGRGDTIPGHVIGWAQRQANMAKKMLADLRAERNAS